MMQSLRILHRFGILRFLIIYIFEQLWWLSFWFSISTMLQYEPHIIKNITDILTQNHVTPYTRMSEAYETYVHAL